jgi:hypothetical protein
MVMTTTLTPSRRDAALSGRSARSARSALIHTTVLLLVDPKYMSSTEATLVTTTSASIKFHGLHGGFEIKKV